MAMPVGAHELKAPPENANEHVISKTNAQWRCGEFWRIINVFNALVIATSGDYPVAEFLRMADGHHPTKPEEVPDAAIADLARALFPESVRQQLCNNELHIANTKEEWVGSTIKDAYTPFPGVQGLHADTGDNAIKYFQGGGNGPLSLEASFILATQLAGINWKTLRERMQTGYKEGTYWLSAMLPGAYPELISESFKGLALDRPLGCVSSGGNDTDDPYAGFYLAVSSHFYVSNFYPI